MSLTLTFDGNIDKVTSPQGDLNDRLEITELELNTIDGYGFTQITFDGVNYDEGGIPYSETITPEDSEYFIDPTKLQVTEKDILDILGQTSWSGDIDVDIIVEEYEGGGSDEDYTLGVMNLFNPTNEQLIQYSSKRWNTNIDLAKMIYTVYHIPIKLDGSIFSDDVMDMNIGDVNTNIKSKYLLTDRTIVDLGVITIPLVYNNVFDYKDVECVAYIPYAEPFVLNADKVVGRSVKLMYVLDLLNGYSETYIVDVDSDSVLYRTEVELLRTIPFIGSKVDTYNKEFGKYVWNGNLTPYIEVRRPKPLNDTYCIGGIPNRICGDLGEYKGYVKVDDVLLESIATSNEKERIVNLLKSGVYIR